MKKTTKTTPARLVVARTQSINELLQEVWALSPELKEKISLTVHQAIVALVRERRRYQAFASDSLSSAIGKMPEASTGDVQEIEDSITEASMAVVSEPHPDSIWND